jgi:hypothetical protein
MKILITTQYRENYGTSDEPYWKFKGGEDYFILDVDPLKTAPGLLVDQARGQIEYSDPMSEEYIVDWRLVDDDYLSDFEFDQWEYEGEIRFPTRVIDVQHYA